MRSLGEKNILNVLSTAVGAVVNPAVSGSIFGYTLTIVAVYGPALHTVLVMLLFGALLGISVYHGYVFLRIKRAPTRSEIAVCCIMRGTWLLIAAYLGLLLARGSSAYGINEVAGSIFLLVLLVVFGNAPMFFIDLHRFKNE